MPFGPFKSSGSSGGSGSGYGDAFFQDLFNRLSGSVVDKAGTEFDRAIGIPSPGDKTRKYFKEAFPGTTPWEQLGSPGASAGVQQANVRRETNTAKEIAKIQANAQVKSAEITARPQERRLDEVDIPQLKYRIDLLKEQTQNQIAQAALAVVNKDWQKLRNLQGNRLIEAEINRMEHGSAGQLIRALSAIGLLGGGNTSDPSWQDTAVSWAVAILTVLGGGKFLKFLKRKPGMKVNVNARTGEYSGQYGKSHLTDEQVNNILRRVDAESRGQIPFGY